MLATFDEFIQQNPICRKFEHDEDMRNVFDYLSQSYVLIQLIDACEAEKTAIAPVARNIENFFSDITKEHINTLDDTFTKQAVGLMVKTILEPFGYVVWKQKNLPKSSRAEKFTSASTYKLDLLAPRTMKVKKQIIEIKPKQKTSSMR